MGAHRAIYLENARSWSRSELLCLISNEPTAQLAGHGTLLVSNEDITKILRQKERPVVGSFEAAMLDDRNTSA